MSEVVFVDENDSKRLLTYNISVLDVIPFYKRIHAETKEHKFEISNKYYHIIDNIIQIFGTNTILHKISAIDCVVMLDFIHNYMTVKDTYKEFIDSNSNLIIIIKMEFTNKNYQFINILTSEADKYTENPEIIKIVDYIMNILLKNTVKIKHITNRTMYKIWQGCREPSIQSYRVTETETKSEYDIETDYGKTQIIQPVHSRNVCELSSDDISKIPAKYHHIILKLLL
jgi:hypothetical protein